MQLHVVAAAEIDPFIVVVHRHGQGDLRRILPDDIFVQICLDLTGGGDGVGHIGVDHLPLRRRHVLQNIHAQVDTLIADVRAGAGNDLGHLVLVLAAEGAANGSFFIVFGQNRFTSF